MRRRDFEAMVREMADGLPADFRAGVASIEVTGKTVPHPSRPGIFTLGECVPHSFGAPGESDAELRSTVLLHYGSFAALAAGEPGFDWREEAWETLTHEVRHHLEWRADVRALEAFDDAVEANYRRHDGEPFEDDVFVDVPLSRRAWRRAAGGSLPVGWHGRSYRVLLPSILPDVLFVTVEGLQPQPAGDLVAVVRRKPGLRDLFRRPAVGSVALRASSVAG
jgi:hypothetical protein